MAACNRNDVLGNKVGTNPIGTIDLGNQVYGVAIINGQLNAVGDSGPGECNVISGDVDEGNNRLQNTPVITAASLVGLFLHITFSLDTLPTNASYLIKVELFTGQSGNTRRIVRRVEYREVDHARGNLTLSGDNIVRFLQPGDQLTATATDADGNSSELSLGFPISGL